MIKKSKTSDDSCIGKKIRRSEDQKIRRSEDQKIRRQRNRDLKDGWEVRIGFGRKERVSPVGKEASHSQCKGGTT